jgi:hypothetical protein
MKKQYSSPEIVEFGTVASLTAAIGSSSRDDQSDFPNEFPPDTGSGDVCFNDNPDSVC